MSGVPADRLPRDPGLRRRYLRLAKLVRWLDGIVGIPGTRFRIGLDPILGLVPGGGDVAAALLSLYVVREAKRMGVPAPLIRRMLRNIALDAALGIVPIVGDIGDVLFRANRRNLAILDEYLRTRGAA